MTNNWKINFQKLTLYVVSPLYLTYQVSFNMTDISLPTSSSSLFPSELLIAISPPLPLYSSSSTSYSSFCSSASNSFALCGNIFFQISFSNFKNILLSRSASSSQYLSFYFFINISLTIEKEKWMMLRQCLPNTRRLYMQIPVLVRLCSERNPTGLKSDSQSNTVVVCGHIWSTTTW